MCFPLTAASVLEFSNVTFYDTNVTFYDIVTLYYRNVIQFRAGFNQ